jgi:hypothetical protein
MFSKAPFTPITMHAPNEPSHPAKPAPYNSHLHPTPVSLTILLLRIILIIAPFLSVFHIANFTFTVPLPPNTP